MRQSRFGMYAGPIYEPDIYLGTLPDVKNSSGAFIPMNVIRSVPLGQNSCSRYGGNRSYNASTTSAKYGNYYARNPMSTGPSIGNFKNHMSADPNIGKFRDPFGVSPYPIRPSDLNLYENSYYYDKNTYFYNNSN